MLGAMLLPQDHQRPTAPLEFFVHLRPLGNRLRRALWKPGGVNSRRSNSASPISGGVGHGIPTTLARLPYSQTAVLPTPVASRTWRTVSPSSCVSRSTSRIFLIDILIPAIGCPCCSRQGLPLC